MEYFLKNTEEEKDLDNSYLSLFTTAFISCCNCIYLLILKYIFDRGEVGEEDIKY